MIKEYTMEQLSEGKTCEKFHVSVTSEMMEMFQTLSGDENPIHTDARYARNQGMRDRVVYGMQTSSFYSKLVGMYLPGKFCILHEIKINFNKPVYSGDSLCVSGVVTKKRELFKRIEIAAKIVNQNGEKVSSAKIIVGVSDGT